MTLKITNDRQLEVKIQDDYDIFMLQSILHDGNDREISLSQQMIAVMPPQIRKDWAEYVTPDLEELYSDQMDRVEADILLASPGTTLIINHDNIEAWYSALNQARLGLEERHQISKIINELPSVNLRSETEDALIRTSFYQELQEFLLPLLTNMWE